MTLLETGYRPGGPDDGEHYETVEDVSPVTGDMIALVPALTASQALQVAKNAAQAFTVWSTSSFVERRRVLLRAADILEEDLELHVRTFATETGATRAWAEMNVHEAAATFREAAGLASSPVGVILPSAAPKSAVESHRGPAGVCLAIVPWNAPLILAARATAIALAVGNTIILRPSEMAPITGGFILADALHRAGLPSYVLSVVTNSPADGPAVISALISAQEIRRVVFIGSTSVGRSIAEVAGRALTPAILELGGKNVTVIRADADIEKWTPALAFASFANSGQVCMCTDRILVHANLYDTVVAHLAKVADSMVVGDPSVSAVDLGPLINASAATRFDQLVADATSHGAKIEAGGSRIGPMARPTVLTGVTESCRFDREEGFVPIVSVTPFSDDDHAIHLANNGDLGLIASVISADETAAVSLARRIRAGAVHVNGPSVGDEPHVPFGGLGLSGAGRLGGAASVEFFTDQRTYYLHR